jgi:DHA3 family macrolide efflux protein-like MFS transporter
LSLQYFEPAGWKKRIAFFLVSQNISLFGSSVVSFSILWHITLATSSGMWMMLATLCNNVPFVVISLFGGVWADRYSRKRLIMLADGFIAMATLLLAVSFLLGYGRLPLLLVALAVRSLGAGVQNPAVKAVYPQLVPAEQLTRIQGINQTLGSVLSLLAPAAGGLVLGTVGIIGAFFLDVVTAAAAIFVMGFIRVERPRGAIAAKTILGDMKDGLAYTFGSKRLCRFIVFYVLSYLLFAPAFVLTPLLIARTFGGEVWRLTVHEIVWAAAAILGGVFVAVKGDFLDKVRTIAVCTAGFGVLFALLGVAWNFTVFLCFLAAAGFFLPVWTTAITVYIQETAAPDKLGRVFSVTEFVSVGAIPVAVAVFGPLADVVPVGALLLTSSALLIPLAIAYALRGRRPT